MEKLKRYKSLDEYFKPILNYRGHTVADIDHSIARFKERMPDVNYFVYERLLKKAINWLYDNKKEGVEDRYIFCSKQYGFGIQLEWRRDRHNPKVLNGYTATTLSNNEMKYFKFDDKKVFVENFIKTGYSLEESKNIVNKGFGRFEFEGELKEELQTIHYNLYIDEGSIRKDFELIMINEA